MPLSLLLIAVQFAAPGSEPIEEQRILPQLDRCSRSEEEDEIVVCGRRNAGDRYRIPENFRDEPEPGRPVRGTGTAALDDKPFAPCGIFEGQRRCNKADSAEFGYGRGRDPITAAGKIISEIADPE